MKWDNKIDCFGNDYECWTQIKMGSTELEIWELINKIFGKGKIFYYIHIFDDVKHYNPSNEKMFIQGELF